MKLNKNTEPEQEQPAMEAPAPEAQAPEEPMSTEPAPADGDALPEEPAMDTQAEEPTPDEPVEDTEGDGDDSTQALLDKLPDDKKEAARKYILSMIDDEEGGSTEEAPMDDIEAMPAPEEQAPEQPVMETAIFTKKQLNHIHETFAKIDDKDFVNPIEKNNGNKELAPNSPFKGKRFRK